MSDFLKHECGIALIRLLKPYDYYVKKYGSAAWGLTKMHLLMEKQHNRGQDGAGVIAIKMDMPEGMPYMHRERSATASPIKDLFNNLYSEFVDIDQKYSAEDAAKYKRDGNWLKHNINTAGELLLGHLRYGTHGKNDETLCHPFIRHNNWKSRTLSVAGNFNMTNVDQLFNQLVELGQHPQAKADTVTVLEKIGHFLDTEVQRIFDKYKDQGYENRQITEFIIKELDVQRILSRAGRDFDGGYVMAGLVGHGDAFVLRDPAGIRPGFYYANDEVAVVASERPCIQTAFNVPLDSIKEITPGHALIITKDGEVSEQKCLKELEKRPCSFERIYFSRGTDADIYEERKKLGYLLADKVMQAVDYDFDNTVFSFIPNTAEVAFYGLVQGVEELLNKKKAQHIKNNPGLSTSELERIMMKRPRVEKVAVKDAKMRTFITEDSSRDELVSSVYDITYGSIKRGVDTLVVVDDSIVRGTTLEKNILKSLDRLGPKKIIVVSSAPQIRYPDCYGIDMAKMNDLVAFKAVLALLKDNDMDYLLKEVEAKCIEQERNGIEEPDNYVKEIYDAFSAEEISAKIAEIVRPKHIFSDVEVIYQSIENLHEACPNNNGDWYFTGKYPTNGGKRVVNRAFLNFRKGLNIRAYETTGA